ncbi:hypothetical protein HYT57_05165 [Candidatus Woesearchaeota archaeon]|nr:hypothetical protein [Candidatus Woesearchaeota archaeon]
MKLKLALLFLLLFTVGCLPKYYLVDKEVVLQGNVITDDFKSYSVDVGSGLNPTSYGNVSVELHNSTEISVDEAIARIKTGYLNEGFNTVRITAKDNNGKSFYEYAYLYVDNNQLNYPENDMGFSLVKEEPANLPTYYYIIVSESQEENAGVSVVIGSEEDSSEGQASTATRDNGVIRIEGSKINVVGRVNNDGLSKYEIDYTYDPDRRVWLNEGIEISNQGDLLGRLDLKNLKYNGILTLRLRTYRGNDIVTSDTVDINVNSKLYQYLGFAQDSRISNLEDNSLSGFLDMGIEKLEIKTTPVGPKEEWLSYKIFKNKLPFSLLKKQSIDLSKIDLGGVKISESGKYRIYARFDDGKNNEVQYYPFDVISYTEKVDKCEDSTLRNSCSLISISLYCDSDLQLVQNCKYCGCKEGFTCSNSGQCTATTPPRRDRTPIKGPEL